MVYKIPQEETPAKSAAPLEIVEAPPKTYRRPPWCSCTPFLCGLWVVLIGSAAILIGIFFGVIHPIIVDRGHYVDTTCTSVNFTVTGSRCCNVLNCACSECLVSVLCDVPSLVAQSLNASTCCGSSQCCKECCSTCCHNECSTDEDGFQHCETVCVDCNCKCCSSVSRRTCSFACGTCTQIQVDYLVTATEKVKTEVMKCGRDDTMCISKQRAQFEIGHSWTCSYDKTNPDDVRFTGGLPGWNIAAWVFFGIFSFIFLVCLGMILATHVGQFLSAQL